MTKTWLMTGAAALALWAGPAVAQTGEPGGVEAPTNTGPATRPEDLQTTDDAATPGDVVVTAQRRSERLQDVPIAITVLSGAAVEASGAINIEGAQYSVPSLNFRKSGTTINQSLFLRGVGTSTFSIAGEPSISTVVDGVVFSRAGEAFSDLVDIDRLEVLRGPQGTLFGKNTSAGVINIVSRRPGDELAGYVEGGYFFGNGNEYRVRGAIDLPLATGLAARVTGFYGNYEGNIRNTVFNTRVNGYEHYGVRGIVFADPTPNLKLTVIADYRRSDDDCCAEVIGTTPGGAQAAVVQVLPPIRGDRTRAVAQNLITRTLETSWGVSGQADWTLGTQTISYIGSYREYDNTEIRDGDFLPQAFSGAGLNQLHDDGPQVSNTITQELRLTSPTDQLVSYVLGAFYSRADTKRTFSRSVIACTSAVLPTLTPCSSPLVAPTTPFGSANFGSLFTNFALFGDGRINFSPRFRGIFGLRFTTDQLEVFHRRVTPLAGPGIQPSFGPFNGKTVNDNLSGRAGVQFDVTNTSVLYGTYNRGYKGPAFNIFFNLNANGTNVIEPETADAFEVGIKNSFFDGRLVLNLAGFYAKYDNFQANNPDLVAGVVVTRFTNAGEISTRGVELDATFQPVSDLTITGGLAYTDARIDRFREPTNGVTTGVVPAGTRLPYAPEWKGSFGLDYRWRTGGPVDIGLGGQAAYQSDQYAQLDASAAVREATTIRAYGLVDLTAAIIDPTDRFRLTFLVKNVFDQSFAASITSGGPGGSYRYIIPREADRFYGVTARVNF